MFKFINPLYNKILTFFKDPTHIELHHHFTRLSKTMTILRGITIIYSSKSYLSYQTVIETLSMQTI